MFFFERSNLLLIVLFCVPNRFTITLLERRSSCKILFKEVQTILTQKRPFVVSFPRAYQCFSGFLNKLFWTLASSAIGPGGISLDVSKRTKQKFLQDQRHEKDFKGPVHPTVRSKTKRFNNFTLKLSLCRP